MNTVESKIIESKRIKPIGKWMVLQPQAIEGGTNIVMPDSRNAARAAGQSVLLVTQIGDDVEKIKEGDYVITKPVTTTLMSFKVMTTEYLMVHEDDISGVLR